MFNESKTEHSDLADSPTSTLKDYSMFKSCYVEIYLGKEEMKNNRTHNYI